MAELAAGPIEQPGALRGNSAYPASYLGSGLIPANEIGLRAYALRGLTFAVDLGFKARR